MVLKWGSIKTILYFHFRELQLKCQFYGQFHRTHISHSFRVVIYHSLITNSDRRKKLHHLLWNYASYYLQNITSFVARKWRKHSERCLLWGAFSIKSSFVTVCSCNWPVSTLFKLCRPALGKWQTPLLRPAPPKNLFLLDSKLRWRTSLNWWPCRPGKGFGKDGPRPLVQSVEIAEHSAIQFGREWNSTRK